MKEITQDFLTRYGFKSEQELMRWAESMDGPDWRFSEDSCSRLYTDGDSGIAEITHSDMFDDDGFIIRPIKCLYVDFKALDLLVIYKELRDEWEYAYEYSE
jgi:hypothetical protein